MINFEFATASRIIFGCGCVEQLTGIIESCPAENVCIVTGNNPSRISSVTELIKEAAGNCFRIQIVKEPDIDTIEQSAKTAGNCDCNLVIGIGGGSVIDAAKAIAALITNTKPILNYLEVVGKGQPLTNRPALCIAIPTTAGTGAEVTRNSVLYVPEKKVKVSMRNELMLPDIALVDPELTVSMPPQVTASTGLDALTQLIESFVSNKANPLTDSLCIEGITRAARSLLKAFRNPKDINARYDMCIASLFGGLALANSKLGAVHGFAGPLGGMIQAPHGIICAKLLPFVFEANVKALIERDKDNPAVLKFIKIAELLTGNPASSADDAVKWINNTCSKLDIPSLADYGLDRELIPLAAEKARNSSSMKGNPIELTGPQLVSILEAAI